MSILSNNMKLLREHLKDTQSQFAKRFKATRGMINSYENGQSNSMPAALVGRITTYFGITTDQLLNQKLTEADLKVTGRIESVVEVKLQSALRENELLKMTIADKDEIIALLKNKHKVN